MMEDEWSNVDDDRDWCIRRKNEFCAQQSIIILLFISAVPSEIMVVVEEGGGERSSVRRLLPLILPYILLLHQHLLFLLGSSIWLWLNLCSSPLPTNITTFLNYIGGRSMMMFWWCCCCYCCSSWFACLSTSMTRMHKMDLADLLIGGYHQRYIQNVKRYQKQSCTGKYLPRHIDHDWRKLHYRTSHSCHQRS